MSAEDNKYKRKRKKSFLKNARKYAKKGCYGRGSQLEADTYQYFVRIMEVYREGFDNQEDKLTFVNNVFEQTEDQEINICCNQVGCRVIEMLLPFAKDAVLERFMDKLGDDMRKLCGDPFASHVLQSLFTQACSTSLKKNTEEIAHQKCKEFTLKLGRFLLNNLEDFVWDTYGNHIIRTVIANMSQTTNSNDKEYVDNMSPDELPEEYQEIVKEYGQRLLSWPQFKDLPYSEITSGLLQIILVALKKVNPKLLKKYLKTLNEQSFSPQNDDDTKKEFCDVFYSKPAVMLLETSLRVAAPKQFTQIYAKCFMNKLAPLAMDKNSNFAVQKLLLSCSEKNELEAIHDELASSFEEILKVGHTGVLLAVAQACKKLSAKQGSYMQEMMKCLNCYEPEERQNSFMLCMTKLVTYEEFNKLNTETVANDKLNLHGVLILQEMLHFHKPIKIVNGILNQETPILKKLFCNSIGSHIVDAYVQSTYVGEKSREKLIRKLKGTYQDLGSSKYGSRVFEALWNVSTIKNRLLIMDELIHKDALWSNSEFGKIIASKINFHLYKRNKEEWKSSLDKTEKKKLLFADITNYKRLNVDNNEGLDTAGEPGN